MCGSPKALGGTAPASLRGWGCAGQGEPRGASPGRGCPGCPFVSGRGAQPAGGAAPLPPGLAAGPALPGGAGRAQEPPGAGRGEEAAGAGGRSGAGAAALAGSWRGAGRTPEVSGEGRAERGAAGGGKVPADGARGKDFSSGLPCWSCWARRCG